MSVPFLRPKNRIKKTLSAIEEKVFAKSVDKEQRL